MPNAPDLPTDLHGVLRYVAENNVRECYDLPDAFQAAMSGGYIEWEYAGAWGQDTLVLTDTGCAELGIPPTPSGIAIVLTALNDFLTSLGRRAKPARPR